MRRFVTLAALILATASTAAQDPPLASVLTFETAQAGGVLTGWATAPPNSAIADDAIKRTGFWSARLERTATSEAEFSVLRKTIPLDVAGKTIALRGFLKTDNVTGFVSLWMREDSASTTNVAFATTQDRNVRGTTDWHEHAITVAVHPDARQLTVGVLLSGTGKAWVDDLELTVDGVPFASAPKVERPKTVLETDYEFASRSRVALDALSPVQIDNLVTLGQVWGFLKYHHPAIRAGQRHWDFDLFRVLPGVLAAADSRAGNAAILKWMTALGPVPPCKPCATLPSNEMHLPPDVKWIEDESRLGADLSRALGAVHTNRPADQNQFYLSLAPGIGNPVFKNEPNYAQIALPDSGYQLLALYRFWNIVQYWFPYRDVIGENWTGVLREFVPRVALAKSARVYQQQLMALIARVHDTHANLWSSLAARPPVGDCEIPARIRFVEGRPVVTSPGGSLEQGDVITALDGTPVTRLIADWSPYYAASNEPTRLRDIGRFMTRGACGDTTVGVTRATGDAVVKTARVKSAPRPATNDLPGDTFRKLSPDVGYLKLSSVKIAEVPKYLEAAAGTKGLVIDIRNYPSEFVVFALGRALVGDTMAFARFTQGDLANPGAFHWGPAMTLTPAEVRYKGQIVILVDEVSQSQAEYTTMAFRTAPGAKVVGSTTAAADGNVSSIPMPAGLSTMISGIGVFYPDKRPTQRIGIIPDVEAKPTIAGIRAGRDEVLEAGIRQILGPGVSDDVIRKMVADQIKPPTFTFDGVSLDTDFKIIAAKYKGSDVQDAYVRLSPADVHDHISSIEVSGAGASRRVRIGFELESAKGPIYPTCADIEQRLTQPYGKPDDIRRFSEEATPRADRIWRSPTEMLTLLCFQSRTQWLAEAVMITPSR